MRLIDADAIPYTMLYKENFLKGTGYEAQAVWKSDIDAMPTVEAFPLEWLINRYAYATEDILVEWENYLKEQSERKEE